MVLRVGTDYKPKSKILFTYFNVKYDADGWANVTEWLPQDYDMCLLKNDKGTIKIGWRSGFVWDGLTITINDKFIAWKRKLNYEQG